MATLSWRSGRGCGVAIYAYDFRHLNTPLRSSRPELDRHAWLEGVDAYAGKRRSMEKSIAGPVRELDKAVPLNSIVPFHLAPNRGRRRFAELWLGKLRRGLGGARGVAVVPLTLRDLGMPRRIAVVPLTLRDLGMPRKVTAIPLFDDLLSTLTNQPASLDDEFGYGFEHARLRTRNSRYSVSGGQSRPGPAARISCDKLPKRHRRSSRT